MSYLSRISRPTYGIERPIEASTYKRYKVFYNLYKRFEGTIMRRIKIKEINPDFLARFIGFCKDEAYSENTIHRSIKFIKTIINFIEKNGTAVPFKTFEYKRSRIKNNMITLSEEELRTIKHTDVPHELEAAKK